ncbi:A24 family peptidase [Anaerostipes sp.]|uniref:A24 family peptidase n=1 Tax=Anaerostipes sp. TaxID=1872530 RepID=UPI0025911683|nr:A24 family peptidase [Anaerostipes sp.]MCI5622820.1 A24 family peptidase [Anaerostipes sp.]
MVIWMLVFLSAAVFYDWKEFRIPNWLTGIGAVITTGICLWKGVEIADIAAGVLLPFFICIGLFYLGCLGGGDIKLLMVCGIPLGTYVFRFLVVSFLWNGVYAIIFLWRHGSFRLRLSYFIHYISECLESRRLIPYQNRLQKSEEDQIHFSTGVLLAYLTLFIF